ncbi:MAG: M20 family metallopeptidase [Maledivibacter sp.]|jgi:amidohydrolase|nr:M20 family metallopeptidase [Maledivibacter sp.]
MDYKMLIEDIKDDIIAIRRKIHENPELAFQEYKTTQTIIDELSDCDVDIKRYGLETGLVVILKGDKEGKTIAFRADMDALRIEEKSGLSFSSKIDGVAHMCGHDIHTSTLLGCIKVLSKLKNEISGRIIFIFQPAEEGLRGANSIIRTGVFDEYAIDYITTIHCWPEIKAGTIGLKAGPMMASSNMLEITIKGKGTHAAHPHKGVDPILISSYIINGLQSISSREIAPTDPIIVSITKIEAGSSHNIVPEEVKMYGTVRTITNETQEIISDIVTRIVENTASAYRADATVVIEEKTSPLIADETLVKELKRCAENSIGVDNIVDLKEPSMGSEDFAKYLEFCKGALIRLGTKSENYQTQLPLHNPRTIFDEKAIETGMKVICSFALDYLK